MKRKKVSDQFSAVVLAHGATERKAHAFLKEYPFALIQLVNRSWNFYRIFPEFKIGTDFRADFVVLSADSGAWHAHFVELEGPHDKPYNRNLTPKAKLNFAIRQTNDWKEFLTSYRSTLLHEFAKLVRPLDAAAQNELMGHNSRAHIELEYPTTYIDFAYHVVIGNSRSFNEKERKAHARHSLRNNVITYDRVYQMMVELESRCETLTDQKKLLSHRGYKRTRDAISAKQSAPRRDITTPSGVRRKKKVNK